MPAKPILFGLLTFWALSIIGSPLAWACQSEDALAITMNAAEEESGKTVKVDPLEEKLMLQCALPSAGSVDHPLPRTTFLPPHRIADFIGEILLPPPKSGDRVPA